MRGNHLFRRGRVRWRRTPTLQAAPELRERARARLPAAPELRERARARLPAARLLAGGLGLVVGAAGLLVGFVEPAAPAAERPRGPRAAPSRAGSTRRHPALRFAVIGDFGTGHAPQMAVADAMCEWRARHTFDLVITTGDNIYPDGDPALFDPDFYRPYACLTDNGVRFHAVLGNHDIKTDNGRSEISARPFGMPARNYVLRKSGVRFVMANSNKLKWGWLRRATRAKPRDRWTIVVLHHPVFSPGTANGSTPGFRPGLPRLFRRRGVDLVLSGHDHIYAASRSLHRIRYIVSGGGGDRTNGCSKTWFSQMCRSRLHFLYVVARRGLIAIKAVSHRGHVFDRVRTRGRAEGRW
jgi:predicted phosphodiesterase